MPDTLLWIVGKRNAFGWEFMGVFDSEEKAVAACRTLKYFVGPAKLNEQLPDETNKWKGAYYPLWGNDNA